MEIESEDGSRIALQSGSKTLFGRGSGFETADRTVSRRQLILETDRQEGSSPSPRASFQVLGKNPVWVRRKEDNGIRVFRRSDKGKLAVGDCFCVAGHQPVWFALKGVEIDKDDDDDGALLESVDVSSDIDPVKEFGFLVIGHEFDRYPKQILRQVKDWDWFLEEGSKNIESDDDGEKKVRRSNKRKKRGHGDAEDNDEDWTGESEDERMDDLEKVKKVRERKYSTRSNDPRKKGGIKRNPSPTQKRDCGSRDEQEDDDDEEDDDDDTLGGFIVKDDVAEPEEPSDVEEEDEEEEELVEEDEDD